MVNRQKTSIDHSMWHLLIYLSRYLDQETAKGPFPSSSLTATCYNLPHHSKVAAIPLGALPENTASELAGLISYPHLCWTTSREAVTTNFKF